MSLHVGSILIFISSLLSWQNENLVFAIVSFFAGVWTQIVAVQWQNGGGCIDRIYIPYNVIYIYILYNIRSRKDF